MDTTLHGDPDPYRLVVVAANGVDGVERVLENPIPHQNYRRKTVNEIILL
jgi:hypothetical protein